ncbi:MAG TPA: FUSC family protein [Pseudomonadales bacterium]|nr:FUSC family protein [Pseudomonadales bacterium]
MAVADLESTPFGRLRRDLAPYPSRLEFATRLALGCALTTCVAEIFQTPGPALTTYVVFFLMKSDRVASVMMSVIAMAMLAVVVAALIVISNAVVDSPPWRVATMTALSFALMFAAASGLRRIAPIVALIAAYALDLLARAQIGELATRTLLYAWLYVGIPAGVTIVLNLLAGPSPLGLAGRAIAGHLTAASRALRASGAETHRAFAEALADDGLQLREWLRLAAVEHAAPPADLRALRAAADSLPTLLLLVETIVRDGEVTAMQRECVAATFDAMAVIFANGSYPVCVELDPVPAAVAPMPAATPAWRALTAALVRLTERDAATADGGESRAPGFVADAFPIAANVRFALKTTAAAMLCYVTYTLLDWPGIHTALITCFVVSLATTGETVEKLSLRVVGCLIGAALGTAAIVYVMAAMTSIGGLLGVVFAVALLSGWIAAGSPRIAYAGFQLAFAFFLCVIQGAGPEFDLAIARDRVIGILFGNVVMFVTFAYLWPAGIGARIDGALVALLDGLRATLRVHGVRRRTCVADAHALLRAIATDLAIARYEPSSVRPTPAWFDTRRRALADVAALERDVVVAEAAYPSEREWHPAAASAATPAVAPVDEPQPNSSPPSAASASVSARDAHALIEARIAAIQRALDRQAPPAEAAYASR